jgi:hypothetical protein
LFDDEGSPATPARSTFAAAGDAHEDIQDGAGRQADSSADLGAPAARGECA